ncbi:hypothetical protein GCM10011312_26680 [Planktosalinus lacus]|uniref:Uncharacterized protein n=1 Tax=Planktosalinus lacus TaxID=1526573 RepID=A0A8J2VCW9_9FLAO|nr:hypothetical protein GCM10011312_26680 [Planktosalinus lacus]
MRIPKPSPYILILTLLLLFCVEIQAQTSKSINSNPPPVPGRDPGWGDDDVDDEAPLPINGFLTLGLITGALYGFRVLNKENSTTKT